MASYTPGGADDPNYTSIGPGNPIYDAQVADPGHLGQPDSSWLSKATNPALVQALQDASKSSLAQQPANTPLAAPTPMKLAAGGPMRALSLDALAQLLEKQRAQYGTLSGQPVAQPRQIGLLGF